jgi:hypothetical protein
MFAPYSPGLSPKKISGMPRRAASLVANVFCPTMNGWNGCSRFRSALRVSSRCVTPLGVKR